jgi:hypothetical protein
MVPQWVRFNFIALVWMITFKFLCFSIVENKNIGPELWLYFFGYRKVNLKWDIWNLQSKVYFCLTGRVGGWIYIYTSVRKHLSSMCKAWGSIELRTAKQQQKRELKKKNQLWKTNHFKVLHISLNLQFFQIYLCIIFFVL